MVARLVVLIRSATVVAIVCAVALAAEAGQRWC
jgi:hypothetical protein